jgi:hypothetical protein
MREGLASSGARELHLLLLQVPLTSFRWFLFSAGTFCVECTRGKVKFIVHMIRKPRLHFCVLLIPTVILAVAASGAARAQNGPAVLRLVRVIDADDIGAQGLAGLPLVPGTDVRLVLDEPTVGAATVVLSNVGSPGGSPRLTIEVPDPINLGFAGWADESFGLLVFDGTRAELSEVEIPRAGEVTPARVRRFSASAWGVADPRGVTIDPASGRIFILDAAAQKIVRLDGGGLGSKRYPGERISEIAVPRGLSGLRGIAFNPVDGHLHLLSPSAQELYELDGAGRFLALRALSALGPLDLKAMTFAPSSDRTDDPSQTNLFLVGRSGGAATVAEWSLTAAGPTSGPAASEPATLVQGFGAQNESGSNVVSLVQNIDAFAFNPPSPDSAGIAYQQSSGKLLMCDSEVNEMPLYQGGNVFELTESGNLFDTFDTTHFSDEPTGVTINPANQHCFFSDDTGTKKVYEVDPGPDATCLTGDDTVTSFRTEDFGSGDPEGVAFGQGTLFVVDGVNKEFYTITPGANGVFDGVPSAGDDQITSCDTASLGLDDPEGITFDPASGHLFVVGNPEDLLLQISTACDLVRTIDISAANAVRPAGATLAPSSVNSGETTLWVADRGVDNDPQPDENDGRIYELSLPPMTPGNSAPVASAGPDQTITHPNDVLLQGSVTDDGIPSPSSLISTWSQKSGPGVVTFDDASQEVTNASFSAAGTYGLRLTGDDGEFQATDDVTITVLSADGSTIVERRVEASVDDAEEDDLGAVSRDSSDLELVFDGEINQVVGIRFNGVPVPPGAAILAAHIQFQVDGPDSDATFLTLEGEAADTAAPFLTATGDISWRLRTAASVAWNPAPWLTAGEAGPDQQTPDLSPILQEIVDRPGWSSGNALAVILTGTGTRAADAFDGDANGAPLLRVRYLVGGNRAPIATITAPPDGSSVAQGDPVALTGTATDAEDGDLSANLTWVSDRDGVLGTGASVMRSDLSVGLHAIRRRS